MEGAGLPISSIITNLFMERFEITALSTSSKHQSPWLRYVDDTFVVQKTSHKNHLFKHNNSVEPNIQLTVE